MKGLANLALFCSIFLMFSAAAQTRMAPKKITRCAGPEGQGYACTLTGSGIVFRSYADSTCQGEVFEKVVLPANSGMNFKINSAPLIACDRSSSTYRGRIYVCWSDLKNGEKNEDVFLSFSEDKGKNWCEPILLTWYPNHKAQVLPAMYCDPRDGRVFVLYFDSRNSQKGDLYQTFLAVSANGGLKFDHYVIGPEKQPQPHMEPMFKFNAAAGKLYAFWQEPMSTNSEKWFPIGDSALATAITRERAGEMKIATGFKFSKKISVKFSLDKEEKVTAVLTKPLDPKFERTLFTDKLFAAGENTCLMETDKLKLKKGSYTLVFYYGNRQRFCWITEE